MKDKFRKREKKIDAHLKWPIFFSRATILLNCFSSRMKDRDLEREREKIDADMGNVFTRRWSERAELKIHHLPPCAPSPPPTPFLPQPLWWVQNAIQPQPNIHVWKKHFHASVISGFMTEHPNTGHTSSYGLRYLHCPKNNLSLGIKNEPVTICVGATDSGPDICV